MAAIDTGLSPKVDLDISGVQTQTTLTAKYPGALATLANVQALSANMADVGYIPVEFSVYVNAAGTVTACSPSAGQTADEYAAANGLTKVVKQLKVLVCI